MCALSSGHHETHSPSANSGTTLYLKRVKGSNPLASKGGSALKCLHSE